MRAPAAAMLIAGLALGCGHAFAQPPSSGPSAPPRYSADGLYNLGNSYARSGQPGLAVLNYERALLLAPGDADIRANLEYVRASAHVPTEPPGILARLALAANPTWAAWIGVLGIALAGTGVLAGKLAPRLQRLRGPGILLGGALITLTVSHAMLLRPRMHEAVVLAGQVPARVSPVPLGEAAFTLRQAETVTVTAEHQDFVLIRTRAGRSGWVSRADLGFVVP
jgi:tetratricopeptide (TPR) repeat protein